MNKLHYFCTIAQVGSLSKASELLNVSQAALSKSMKNLEADFGLKLILPEGRGITISDHGQRLAKAAQPLIEQVHNLKNQVIEREQTRTHMKIGSFIDMGVFVKKGSFTKNGVLDLEYIVPNIKVEGTPSKVNGLDGWPDSKYPRKIVHRVAMLQRALLLCGQGEGAGFFPEFVVERYNRSVKPSNQLIEKVIPSHLKVKTKQDVFLVKRKTDIENQFIKKTGKQIRKI